ncbi:unnamed protein product, partial [Ixodes persulcatus]
SVIFLALTPLVAAATRSQPVFSIAARDALYRGALALTLQVANHQLTPISHAHKDDNESNVLLSPLALALSTALVLEGSVSKTIDRLLETLRWELLKDADVRYVLAHALLRLSRLPISDARVEAAAFVQRDFDVTGPYRESLDAYYGADVVLVNFLDRRATLTAVNAWCCRATAKVITSLLQEDAYKLDVTARFLAAAVVTLNLTHFEGLFPDSRVQRAFYAVQQRGQSVDTMVGTGSFGYLELRERGFKVLELPTLSTNLSLLLALPHEGTPLKKVREAFAKEPDLLLGLHAQLKQTLVRVSLPVFKASDFPTQPPSVCGLKSSLMSMGHSYMFDRFQSNMGTVSKHGHVFMSDMLNGVAVAVSPSARPGTTSRPPTPKPGGAVSFQADRPFLYFVLDRADQLPLALGQFGSPSGSGELRSPQC